MKEYIKYFLCFVLGAALSGVSVYAATIISSKDVSFDNAKSGMKSANVQDAVDELFTKANTGNAGAGDILYGKSALVNGQVVNGSMTNNGSTGGTINPGGSYKIPAGYTSGGTVTANPNQNSGTYIYPDGSTGPTVDMGVNNTYRYVNADNVYKKGLADGASSSSYSSAEFYYGATSQITGLSKDDLIFVIDASTYSKNGVTLSNFNSMSAYNTSTQTINLVAGKATSSSTTVTWGYAPSYNAYRYIVVFKK